MPITDPERWDEYVKTNSTDPYSKCCVDVARRVMEILDEDPTPLRPGYNPDVHTPHGIICKADKDIEAGGITGFMAGAAAQMVAECHSRGEEFRKIWNREHGAPEEAPGTVNPAVMTLELPEGVDPVDAIRQAAEAAGLKTMSHEETLEYFGIEPGKEKQDGDGPEV